MVTIVLGILVDRHECESERSRLISFSICTIRSGPINVPDNIYGLLAIVIVGRYDSNHLLRAQDIAQSDHGARDDNEKERNYICDY